jgi:high-affinity Fe2+/Pb2+ permease
MYQKDSNKLSLLWGRIGAAVLLLISTALAGLGYTFGEAEQAAAFEAVASVLAALAVFPVVASKIRESKKVKQEQVSKIKGE